MGCVVVHGGGDLATGVAIRLHRSGIRVVITELTHPLAVRRTVSFAEAVYEGDWTVEDVTARRVGSAAQALELVGSGMIPVLVAPASVLPLRFPVLVDARLTKRPGATDIAMAPLVIGLGPGFVAGTDCHAVVETKRGHTLGRVYWSGSALPDTSTPEGDPRRVVRSPADGVLAAHVAIGEHVEAGQLIGEVNGSPVTSPLSGVVRGFIRPGLTVSKGLKIGDVDPRDVRERCFLVSDKALAIGGGVLEAILARADVRDQLFR